MRITYACEFCGESFTHRPLAAAHEATHTAGPDPAVVEATCLNAHAEPACHALKQAIVWGSRRAHGILQDLVWSLAHRVPEDHRQAVVDEVLRRLEVGRG
jgi:hypothetical protein